MQSHREDALADSRRSRPKRLVLAAAAFTAAIALLAGVWIRFGAAGAEPGPARPDPRAPHASAGDATPLPDVAAPARKPVPRVDESLAAELPLRPSSRGLVSGDVRLAGGDGIADVQVHLSLHRGLARRELGVAITDAHGRYAFELDLAAEASALGAEQAAELARVERALAGLEPGARDDALLQELERRRRGALERELEPLTLRARVLAAGHLPARAAARLSDARAQRVRLDLVLARGSGVRGVVHHRGAPLPDARVHLFDEQWRHQSSATSDARGEYVLPLPEPGRFRLHARRDGAGAAGTSGYSLGEALPYLSIDLDADGLAVLYGRARLFDGTPLVGLRLEALNAALFVEELAGGPALPFSRLARAEEPGGLRACAARSDGEGRVVFEGLHEGSYAVRLAAGGLRGVPPFGPFATGGEEHELVLDAHVLTVEIAPPRAPGGRARFDAPVIELLALARPEPGDERRPSVLRALAPAVDPVASFVVEPERTWRVLARTLEHTAAGEVRVPAGRHLTHLALELGPWDEAIAREFELASDEELGTLELAVVDEAGARFPQLALSVWPAGAPERALLHEEPMDPDALSVSLPPGLYDVRARVLGEQAEWTVPLPVQRDVLIASGTPTHIELIGVRGGRLRVRLHEVFVPRGFGRASAVAVTLRDARTGAILERPEFELAGLDASAVDVLYPGESGTSAPIAPGRYTIAFESSWFTPPARWVELRAGETSEVAPLLVTPHVEVQESDPEPAAPGADDSE